MMVRDPFEGLPDIETKPKARATKTEPKQKPKPRTRQDPPEGIHRTIDGAIFKVQRAVHGSGRLYAKRLIMKEEEGEFVYVGRGPFNQLSDDTLLSLEEAV